MIYSKKQKLELLGIWLFLVFLGLLTVLTQLAPIQEVTDYNLGMHAFFHIFNGNRIMIYFFAGMVLVIPSIIVVKHYKFYHNNFTSFILLRIPYKCYMKKMLTHVFCVSFVFYLALNIAIFALVHFFYTPIKLSGSLDMYALFSTNTFINLVLYMTFSSIGFALYSLFLVALIPFIKNEFTFRTISLINFVLGLLSYALLVKCIASIIPFTLYTSRTLLSFTVPLDLYTPGLLFEENGVLAFAISCIFYGGAILILMWLTHKKRLYHD